MKAERRDVGRRMMVERMEGRKVVRWVNARREGWMGG